MRQEKLLFLVGLITASSVMIGSSLPIKIAPSPDKNSFSGQSKSLSIAFSLLYKYDWESKKLSDLIKESLISNQSEDDCEEDKVSIQEQDIDFQGNFNQYVDISDGATDLEDVASTPKESDDHQEFDDLIFDMDEDYIRKNSCKSLH